MADTAERRGPSRGSLVHKLMSARVVVGLVVLVLAILFIVENSDKVRIHFIFFTAHSRLWVGFLVSLVFGALLGQAFFFFRRKRGLRSEHQAPKDSVAPGSVGP